jgi:hypothetical protein
MKIMNSVKKIVDIIRKNFMLLCGISLLLLLFILRRSSKSSIIEGHDIGEGHTHDNAMVHEGPIGDEGEAGPRGDLGMRGKKGEAGPEGDFGPQGVEGEEGDRGRRGKRGYRGKRGWRGPQGASAFSEREEDLIRDAVRNSDTLTRGLAQTQAEVSDIKNALAEDYTEDPVFTTENTENMLVSGTEEMPEEETEGFFSKIFGF